MTFALAPSRILTGMLQKIFAKTNKLFGAVPVANIQEVDIATGFKVPLKGLIFRQLHATSASILVIEVTVQQTVPRRIVYYHWLCVA